METLKKGNVYNGFKLIEERNIKEINSLSRLFYHEKSGARLFHLENEDSNKVFSVSFRTPSRDSTGLAHILEHAVLCGSKKFPLKDPFIELAKGSLNTYLNAMTFSDKTMYPIASQNDKDFINLMDVYLDAVFNPNIYKGPETFMQEGWHYEIKSPEEPINIKGVVYNEMKGAFSSPEQILFRKIEESLFPDTSYRFESGGDPDVIPQLTYENFLDFHKNYYHPSNSYIYLYGNMNIVEQLKFIDEEYLNEFNKVEVSSNIKLQDAFEKPKETIELYSISEDEDESGKTYLAKNYVVGKSTDPEKSMAFDILNYLLLGTEGAPLKKALIKANIGKDVFGSHNSSLLQPTFSIIVKNSEEKLKEQFEEILNNTLNDIVEKGIDKKLIESAINIYEFRLREADYGHRPKGLVYNIKLMESWLYDEEPWVQLEYEKDFENIKTALNTNYFEKLIKEELLENNHSSLFILKPDKELANKKQNEELEALEEYKNNLTEKEVRELIKANSDLEKFQTSVESEEILTSIPLLDLEDIDKNVERIPFKEIDIDGIKIVQHNDFTNEIAYINLFFDATTVPQDLIPYTVLLSSLIGKIRTDNYSYEELSNLIDTNTGGVYSKIEAYPYKYSDEEFMPKLRIRGSSLTKNLSKLFSIITDLTNNTKFDENIRIKELISELKSRIEMNIFDQGHAMAARRVGSYFSPLGKYTEETYGVSYYRFISELDKNFDKMEEEILDKLKQVYKLIFNKNNIIASFTSEENVSDLIKKEIVSFTKTISDDKLKRYKYEFILEPKNEGLLTSGKVQYVAQGYNYKRLGYEYTGHMQVLKTIVSLDYLWNEIRVAGGAYGALASFSKNGNLVLSSYRDPNLTETFQVYNKMHDYVKNFNADHREMKKYIIGTISNMDMPLSPLMKGNRVTAQYITGITDEELQIERNEILRTTVEDIKKYDLMIKDIMKENYICVLGNEDKIKNSDTKFDNLVKVFE